jgi:RNA polymerase sigma-70 factor, ECF subfamily
VALALRTLCRLSTAEVARALLVPEATMNKRLTRAKQKIARAAIPYRVPGDHGLPDRLRGVVATVYLLFNEGYAATAGDDPRRPALVDEAVRLTRLLRELMPGEPWLARTDEARAAYTAALALPQNAAQHAHLRQRLGALDGVRPPEPAPGS